MEDRERRAIKPDAQPFDEIRFVTTPRYKESGLSGDEWRISITIEFYRNGVKVHESGGLSKMETAMGFAYAEFCKACDDGMGLYAGDENFCDQEGCSNEATVKYFLKKKYNNDGSEAKMFGKEYRLFCDRHKTRGDCALEDADYNYIK